MVKNSYLGTQWEYGTGIDWAGKMVEAVSGKTVL